MKVTATVVGQSQNMSITTPTPLLRLGLSHIRVIRIPWTYPAMRTAVTDVAETDAIVFVSAVTNVEPIPEDTLAPVIGHLVLEVQ